MGLKNLLMLMLLICPVISIDAKAAADPFAELDQGVADENAKFKKDMEKLTPEQRANIEYMKSHNGQLPPSTNTSVKPALKGKADSLDTELDQGVADENAKLKKDMEKLTPEQRANIEYMKSHNGQLPPKTASKNQFTEAEKRAKLAVEVCGNGHEATIEWGKVTACDGKPIVAGAQNTSREEKKSSLECVVVDKYLYCNDENFYERVSPIVEVQLKKIAKGVVDRNRSAEKTVDHSTSAGEKPSSGREK